MKFRMFNSVADGRKIAVNVDHVLYIVQSGDVATGTVIVIGGLAPATGEPIKLHVSEDFTTVASRLSIVAE